MLSIFSESLKIKKMKTLYRINQIVLMMTFVLYLTLYLGLLSQILLGVIQVVSAIILLGFWKTHTEKIKNQLYIYWIIVTLYGLIWLIYKDQYDEYFVILGMLIPMIIASYFFYILNSIKNTPYT